MTAHHPHQHGVISEALLESLNDHALMLLLNDRRGRCKHLESAFSFLGLRRLAKLEESAKQLRPRVICTRPCQQANRPSPVDSGQRALVKLTILSVLPSDFCNSVANLVSDVSVSLRA
jgi:hypothetical protein